MRIFAVFLCGASFLMGADAAEETAIIATIQKTFDGMAAHDGEMVKSAFTPDARLMGVTADKVTSLSREDFVTRISSGKDPILERIWNPKIQVRGRIATVWAEYDFHLNGKMHHCGIDAFLLLKTEDGWKITSLEWTTETAGCPASPLGPPKS